MARNNSELSVMKEEIVEVTFLQRDDMVLVKAEGTFPGGSSKDFSVFI